MLCKLDNETTDKKQPTCSSVSVNLPTSLSFFFFSSIIFIDHSRYLSSNSTVRSVRTLFARSLLDIRVCLTSCEHNLRLPRYLTKHEQRLLVFIYFFRGFDFSKHLKFYFNIDKVRLQRELRKERTECKHI